MATAHDTHTHTSGSDRKAAFLGLIIGAIVIFAILRTIIAVTNHHYASERPAAEATK